MTTEERAALRTKYEAASERAEALEQQLSTAEELLGEALYYLYRYDDKPDQLWNFARRLAERNIARGEEPAYAAETAAEFKAWHDTGDPFQSKAEALEGMLRRLLEFIDEKNVCDWHSFTQYEVHTDRSAKFTQLLTEARAMVERREEE